MGKNGSKINYYQSSILVEINGKKREEKFDNMGNVTTRISDIDRVYDNYKSRQIKFWNSRIKMVDNNITIRFRLYKNLNQVLKEDIVKLVK